MSDAPGPVEMIIAIEQYICDLEEAPEPYGGGWVSKSLPKLIKSARGWADSMPPEARLMLRAIVQNRDKIGPVGRLMLTGLLAEMQARGGWPKPAEYQPGQGPGFKPMRAK